MENDILDSLEDHGYSGPLIDENALSEAVEAGAKSVAFTQLVEWLVSQLATFCNIDEKVSAIQGPSDSENFLMELSGFLREFSCPYSNLTEGPIEGRLASRKACLQLLDYLLAELASVKMVSVKNPALLSSSKTSTEITEPSESDVAKHLRIMLMALKIAKPPANITAFQMFSKVESKLKELMSQCPEQAGKPLLKARLSEKQWAQVLAINEVLSEEYRIRREMLLKRLDVTIQSFKWSDKAKKNENKIAEVYQPIRKVLVAKTNINVPQILAARDDLTRIQKTSSGEAREKTKCAINRVLIGKVPDRGGRAWELEPPPPEMPAFMSRDSGRGGGGGGRGGGGRGGGGDRGGGRVQGGWGGDSQQAKNVGGNWTQGGGGYHQGGGGGGGGGGRGGGYQGGSGGGYQGGGGGGGGYQGGGGGGGYQGGGGGGYQAGGGGYQGGVGGGYQGGVGGGYQGGVGGGYHGGGGGGGYQGGGGGGYQGGGGGTGGYYQGDHGGGRGGGGGRGRGGRGGRGR